MIPDSRRHKRKPLKPSGHSATIESLVQPAIVIGSTLMSAIAAYVLALDEITRIINGTGSTSDWFIVLICAGVGFLIDMAIIISATRYKMHKVRNDPREDGWLTLAKIVLAIGLLSETMTLFYFFVHLSQAAFPGQLVALANNIHAALAISRAFLPPVVIAYFAAGILPVMFDRSDRNREIKSRTSSNVMVLIDRLSEVEDTEDKGEMLRALGGQLMLATYAEYDETGRTTEDEQLRRDGKLLLHLARIHRLDLSAIAADVAPELVTHPHTPPEPPTPPTGGVPAPAPLAPDRGLNPLAAEQVRTLVHSMPEAMPVARHLSVMPKASAGRRRNAPGRRTKVAKRDTSSVEDLARAAWRPGMTISELQAETGISRGAASKYLKLFEAQHSSVESA